MTDLSPPTSFIPSRDLPLLARRPRPSLTVIIHALDQLAIAFGVDTDVVICDESIEDVHFSEQGAEKEGMASAGETANGLLIRSLAEHGRIPTEEEEDMQEEEDSDDSAEAFERRWVLDWLTRLIASGLEWTKGEEDGGADLADQTLDRAAQLLAICAGKAASGPTTRTFSFPIPSVGSISVRLRDASLTDDALGVRTWGAAPLLARRLVHSFFTSDGTKKKTADLMRVLELGSGTGLCGLAVAACLRQQAEATAVGAPTGGHEADGYERQRATLFLTDYHPTVLNNLHHNVALNSMDSDVLLGCHVAQLDWADVFRASRDGRDGLRRLPSTLATTDGLTTSSLTETAYQLPTSRFAEPDYSSWPASASVSSWASPDRAHPDVTGLSPLLATTSYKGDRPSDNYSPLNANGSEAAVTTVTPTAVGTSAGTPTVSLFATEPRTVVPAVSTQSPSLDDDSAANSFTLLIAADCVYDVRHPHWIRAVAERYLAFPKPRPSGSDVGLAVGTSADDEETKERYEPTLHVVVPLRPTHPDELAELYKAFPLADTSLRRGDVAEDAATGSAADGSPLHSHRLVIAAERELRGWDDFGAPRLRLDTGVEEIEENDERGRRRRARRDGTRVRFRWFEIRWERTLR